MLGVIASAAVLAWLVLYLAVWSVVIFFYDPKGLRRYPCYSFLSGVTDLRHCYLASQGSRSKDLYEEHVRRAEPILRIGPNSLSFCDTRAIKGIYGHNTRCLKDENYNLLSGSHRNLFDVTDTHDHGQKRRLLSAAFAIKNLEKWEHKIDYTTRRLFKVLDTKCTPPLKTSTPDPREVNVDFNHWINLWTIEAINYICVSSKMDLLDTGTDEVTAERPDGSRYRARYRLAMNEMVRAPAVFVWEYRLWPWLKWLSQILPTHYRSRWTTGAQFEDVTYHQAAERLRRYQAGEKGLDDFFSCLMDDKAGRPNNLEWGEVVSEINALLNAGFETTGIALTHALELLIKHPLYLQMLREELDMVLDPEEEVALYDKVKDLPFLRACIDESLRIIPPVSAGLPRRTPAEGAQIMDHWIPGHTSVNMTVYAAHRDPEIFKDPEVFDPTRWLNLEDRKRMESAFIPFSAGSRGCLGRNITYLEQIIMIASLVHRYDFALPTPEFALDRFEAFNILCGQLPIKIWRRPRSFMETDTS